MDYVKKFTTNPEHEPGHSYVPQGKMEAVVWHGGKSIKVEHVDRPKIQKGSDLIVKVTACSINPGFSKQVGGGDIPGMEKGQILGREAVGIVDEVGAEIEKFQRGDRVVISFIIACGECSFCKRREFSACNRTNDSKEFADTYGGWAPAAMFGGSRLYGNVPGSQAQYVRVPFGDANCYKVPNDVPDEKAVFVADTATTGLHACELGQVNQGDTVVIFGLGPVGLMTAKWAKIKGAKRVIGVDLVHDRLRDAFDKCGLEVVDRSGLSSEEVCQKLMKEFPEGGADVCIDACGSCGQGLGWKQKMEKAVGMGKESSDILRECLTVTRKYGNVAVIADYSGYVNKFPIGHVMMKHLTVRAGQTPVQYYMKQVMDAIESGELDPSVLISHHYALNDAAEAYEHAFNQAEGYLKILIHPEQQTMGGHQQHSGRHQQHHPISGHQQPGHHEMGHQTHPVSGQQQPGHHEMGHQTHGQQQTGYGEMGHQTHGEQQTGYGEMGHQTQQGYGTGNQHTSTGHKGEGLKQKMEKAVGMEGHGESRHHHQDQSNLGTNQQRDLPISSQQYDQTTGGTSHQRDQPISSHGTSQQYDQTTGGYGTSQQHQPTGIGQEYSSSSSGDQQPQHGERHFR